MKINLIVGDWSGDGHEKTEVFIIESNLSPDEIKDAYAKGSKILGFNLIRKVCIEYEDNFIPFSIAKILNSHLNTEFNIDGQLSLVIPKQWVDLYLKIVHLGNDSFKYGYIAGVDINIGGYGLFF